MTTCPPILNASPRIRPPNEIVPYPIFFDRQLSGVYKEPPLSPQHPIRPTSLSSPNKPITITSPNTDDMANTALSAENTERAVNIIHEICYARPRTHHLLKNLEQQTV